MKRLLLLLALLTAPAVTSAQLGQPVGSSLSVNGSITTPGAVNIATAGTQTGAFKVVVTCLFTGGVPAALDVTNIALNYGGANFILSMPAAINVPVTYAFDRVYVPSATLVVRSIATATTGVIYTCTMIYTPVA